METDINKHYNWSEGTLDADIIHPDTGEIIHKTYLLYNHITNDQLNGNTYKLIFFDLPTQNPNDVFIKRVSDYRKAYAKYIKTKMHPNTFNKDNGISAIYDAIINEHEDLVILYKNKKLDGAASYSISKKLKCIIVGHIGVIERNCGSGTLIMNEIFKMAKTFNYEVRVTSNGYADDFYFGLGMIKIQDTPLGIYSIKPNNIKKYECDRSLI